MDVQNYITKAYTEIQTLQYLSHLISMVIKLTLLMVGHGKSITILNEVSSLAQGRKQIVRHHQDVPMKCTDTQRSSAQKAECISKSKIVFHFVKAAIVPEEALGSLETIYPNVVVV